MIGKSIALFTVLAAGLTPAAASAAPVAEPTPDATFLQVAHQGNLAEIAAGGVASKRGVSAQVRALGARFVRDHTAIDSRLAATAGTVGVPLPDTPDAAQLALMKQYQSVPSAAFDALFLRTQLTAHRKAMAAGKTELSEGRDVRVKQVAQYAAPIVQAHHESLLAAEADLGVTYGDNARHH